MRHLLLVQPILEIVMVLAIVFSVVLYANRVFTVATTGILPDFRVYHSTAQLVRAGVNPYTAAIEFIYPPSAIPLLLPLAVLSAEAAETIWTVTSAVLLCVICWIVAGSYYKKDEDARLAFWIGLSISSWLFPTKFTLGMGQINFVVLAAVVIGWMLIRNDYQKIGGICLGLAVSLKLVPIVFCVPLIKKQKFTAVLWTVAMWVALHLPAVLWYGFDVVPLFYRQVASGIPTIDNAVYYNQALTGLLARLGVSTELSVIINTVVLVVLLALAWMFTVVNTIDTKKIWFEWGIWQLILLLVGGLAWQHHLVWVIPVLLVAFFVSSAEPVLFLPVIVGAALIGANFAQPIDSPLWPLVSSHATYGAILLFAFSVVVLAKQKNTVQENLKKLYNRRRIGAVWHRKTHKN